VYLFKKIISLLLCFIFIFTLYPKDKFVFADTNKEQQIIFKANFESAKQEGFVARGQAKLSITENVKYQGKYSLYVQGRKASWQGTQVDVKKILKPGKTYQISLWVYHASSKEEEITLTMQRKFNTDKEDKYDTMVWKKKVSSKKWTQIEGTYKLPSQVKVETLIFYIESPNATLNFYIDDVKIYDKSSNNKEAVKMDIPSLYKTYEKYFKIGVALPYYTLLDETEVNLIKKHFNSITAENEMKPESIQRYEGSFYFSVADEYLAFAQKNNIAVRGHTLVWHQQTPYWFFVDEEGNTVSKDLLLKRLKTHIQTVVSRYKGKIYAWDVVNEAVDENQSDGYRRSQWFDIIGPEYIEKAFEFAHEADPNAKLFYNDYDTENPRKREFIYNLVKRLKQKGIPIHGIGIQCHINIDYPQISDIEETIKLFSSIPNIEIHFNEIDMSIYSDSFTEYEQAPEELLIKQGYKYKELFDLLKKYSKVITSVTFWGLKDDYSWLTKNRGRNDFPLLFDKDYKPKFAFWGVVDPKKLPPMITKK